MRLLPLVLSADASSWRGDADVAGRQERKPPKIDQPCRFCGWNAAGWQGMVQPNGHKSGEVVACVLCNLVLHLDRPQIDAEAVLIWLPEMSQAAIVALARHIHLILVAHGEPATMDRRPRRDDPALVAAYSAYRALLGAQTSLAGRLGTTRPSDVGAVLLGFDPARYARRAALLAGIRLVPLGRVFEDGVDIYPTLLASAGPEQSPC
jgi:intracellular multiplication protein IcmJ